MARYREESKSSLATTSLVLGIVGICTSLIPIINNISAILAFIGAICGMIALVKKTNTGKAIAGLIISIITIIIVFSFQKSLTKSIDTASNDLKKATGSSTEEILQNDVDVQLGNFEVNKDNYGLTETKMNVTVTNKLTEKKSFNIHVEAIDNNGTRIAEDYIYVNDLGAGQNQNFEIFKLVTSDKITAMQNATFKIIEASEY